MEESLADDKDIISFSSLGRLATFDNTPSKFPDSRSTQSSHNTYVGTVNEEKGRLKAEDFRCSVEVSTIPNPAIFNVSITLHPPFIQMLGGKFTSGGEFGYCERDLSKSFVRVR